MEQTWMLNGLVVIVVVGILWLLRRREPAETAQDAVQQMVQASNIALDAVQAAEQLWRTGALPKDDRFDYVFDELGVLFPDLTEKQLRIAIESAVYWTKFGVEHVAELRLEEAEARPRSLRSPDFVPD